MGQKNVETAIIIAKQQADRFRRQSIFTAALAKLTAAAGVVEEAALLERMSTLEAAFADLFEAEVKLCEDIHYLERARELERLSKALAAAGRPASTPQEN